ncbi:MAG TPA: hypothetical protein VFC78_07540 [Tepidisphaeraceae bacterium]|nr:hypothetical protein [Tepidisphaeraceae bacterium]
MNSDGRREILLAMEELSDCFPDVRLGQLIANLSYMAKGPSSEAIWDVEDEELLAAARKQLASRKAPAVARSG